MKTVLKIALLASFTGFCAPAASADPVRDVTPLEQLAGQDAPTRVLLAYAQAINAKDVAAMGRLVAVRGKDFTVFEGSGANTGWADYRDHHLVPEFANPDLVFHTYAFENIKTRRDGDLAFSTFSIKMVYTYKGEKKSRTGRGTAILTRDADAWKIVHLHTS